MNFFLDYFINLSDCSRSDLGLFGHVGQRVCMYNEFVAKEKGIAGGKSEQIAAQPLSTDGRSRLRERPRRRRRCHLSASAEAFLFRRQTVRAQA